VSSSDIKQINNYYPFGLNMEGNWTPSGANGGGNKYQYNGKEWNDDFSLGWNDYGARMYDAAVARWMTVDPLAEKYIAYSPYNYVLNSPIIFIDPDGMQVRYDWDAHDRGQKGVYRDDDGNDVGFEGARKELGLDNGFQDFTKGHLLRYARGEGKPQGAHCNPCSENQLGDLFEMIFGDYVNGMYPERSKLFGFKKNSEKFSDADDRNTVPDFTSNTIDSYDGATVPNSAIYEVKQKNRVYLSTDEGQIKGHIDNLAAKHASRMARGFTPEFTLVTVGGVKYSKGIAKYAASKGIAYTHMTIQYSESSSGQWNFRFVTAGSNALGLAIKKR
jgi:RHS repeat-associated protein